MTAIETISPDPLLSIMDAPTPETLRESSLDSLMEKLRLKSAQYRSWPEMSKSLRVAVTEKRHLMNGGDRSQLQKVLDTLQKSIKVTSFQSMAERIESISRQVQGVRFSNRYPTPELYIYNDMFYVEIMLEISGAVKDVKINHHAESTATVTCPELVRVLKAGNFSEFTKHVEGLASIYQLNAEKMQKSQAFLALQALETDLGMLAQLKSSGTEPRNLVHNSPVGILQKRRGGYSLKLTYFISPYDLLDVETKTSLPLTAETVIEKGLGQSVTVCIESSTAHKLQTTSLITITKTSDGRSQPQFAALSNLNSTILPANFVLRLPKPIPMATSLVKEIQNVTNAKIPDCGDLCNAQPLLSVIINDTSNGKLSAGDQGLCVTLPDQNHCYYLNSSPDLQGVMVSSIPFTHPTHVPQILVFLRQQMLFNTVIGSCIRPSSKQDAESPFMFEGMAYSTSHILVSFEHPLEESLATVDIDLKDLNKVSCKIYTLSSDATMCTDDYASKVLQRCLSIPITMRAVIRKAQGQQQLMRSSSQGDTYCQTVNSGGTVSYLSHIPNYGAGLTNGSTFSGGDFSNLASRMCNKDGSKMATAPSNSETQNVAKCEAESPVSSGLIVEHEAPLSNSSSTADSYQSEKPKVQKRQQSNNAMLMSMLSDMPSANPSSATFPFLGSEGKSRKRKKRCSNKSPNPKRKMSEDEYRSTPDGDAVDSPLAYEACSSLPASLPSSALTDHQVSSLSNMESAVVKTEQPASSGGFPHRSASTDSYLMHDEFQARQMLSDNPELVRNFSQVKGQYFGGDTIMDIKGYLAATESNFVNASMSSDIDDDNSLSMDSSQSSNLGSKMNCNEKSKKKFKESVSESSLKHIESISSDENSIGDSQKMFIGADVSQSEDSSLSSKLNASHSQMFVGTSLKIAKSGDGLKLSKSKQKEGKKTSSSGESSESSKKKSEAKKERKRKKAESQSGSSSKSSSVVRPFHLNLDSSLMPPPSSSSSETSMSASSSDSHPIRPITLNVKASPMVTSSSNSQSKPAPYSKKSSSSNLSSGGISKSKSSSSEKVVKPSPPRSAHFPSGKSDSEFKSKVKVPSKHKQSSSGSKSSSTGRSSPSKPPKSATLKLKSYPLPSSVTLTPIDSKLLSSPTRESFSDVLTIQAMGMNPTSPTGKSKASKAALRSRSLNAVIDKLTTTAANAQHILPDGTESFRGDGTMRGEIIIERKEPKVKDLSKDSRDPSLLSKTSENKPKYSSSDQFTVKQSSQGIKLSITKTRSSDGSSKSSKSKQSSKSVTSSTGKTSSSSNLSKSGNVSPASKKIYPPGLTVSPKVSSSSKPPSQKISSPSSSGSPRHGTSANNMSKSVSKHLSSSSQNKPSKLFDKTEKKILHESKPVLNEVKEVIPTSLIVGSMRPPASLNKVMNDQSRLTSGRSPKRAEDATRQSPRHTPTREVVCLDESDDERTYRFYINQSKKDQTIPMELTTSKQPQTAVNYSNDYLKVDMEEKNLWVSSSSDINLKSNRDQTMENDINCIQINEKEVSSSRYEGMLNAEMVSSSEDMSRHLKMRQSDEESSPDLIIDCDSDDRRHASPIDDRRHIQPQLNDDRRHLVPPQTVLSVLEDNKLEKQDSPPANYAARSQPTFLLKSPAQMLAAAASNHAMSFGRIEIDDDLMDEALMPVEK